MGRKRFAVNWSDPPFPRIYRDDEGGTSLAEAKREIVEHFAYDISHARMMIRDTKALRARDIEARDDEDLED